MKHQQQQMIGQVSIRKADLAMNSIYSIVKKQDEQEKRLAPDKIQGYLNSDCALPLPKYQDGGVFANYIQTSQQQFHNNDDNQLHLEQMTPEPPVVTATKFLEKTQSNNTNSQVNALGKVVFTKQMVKDREKYLGVANNQNRLKGGRGSKQEQIPIKSGNESLQQAWNVCGLLPTQINPAGLKNAVKDFEYLKFLNDTILRDEVLDKFMQKAGEIEQAAGPLAHSLSPKKKQSQMTPLEKIELEKQRNPHRFFTSTRFETFFQNNRSSTKSKRKVEMNQQDFSTISAIRERERSESLRRNNASIAVRDINSSDRHRSCAPIYQPNMQLLQQNSSKNQKIQKNNQRLKSFQESYLQKSSEQKLQSIKRILENKTYQDYVGEPENSPKNKKINTVFGSFAIMANKLDKKSIQENSQRKHPHPQTAAASVSRNRMNKTQSGDAPIKFNESYCDENQELKQVESRDLSPNCNLRGVNQKFSTLDRQAKNLKTNVSLKTQKNDPSNRQSALRTPLDQNYSFVVSSKSSTRTNKRGTTSSKRKREKLITNITGDMLNDKLKLDKRLNEAVDDLIRKGQQQQILSSTLVSSRFSQKDVLENGRELTKSVAAAAAVNTTDDTIVTGFLNGNAQRHDHQHSLRESDNADRGDVVDSDDINITSGGHEIKQNRKLKKQIQQQQQLIPLDTKKELKVNEQQSVYYDDRPTQVELQQRQVGVGNHMRAVSSVQQKIRTLPSPDHYSSNKNNNNNTGATLAQQKNNQDSRYSLKSSTRLGRHHTSQKQISQQSSISINNSHGNIRFSQNFHQLSHSQIQQNNNVVNEQRESFNRKQFEKQKNTRYTQHQLKLLQQSQKPNSNQTMIKSATAKNNTSQNMQQSQSSNIRTANFRKIQAVTTLNTMSRDKLHTIVDKTFSQDEIVKRKEPIVLHASQKSNKNTGGITLVLGQDGKMLKNTPSSLQDKLAVLFQSKKRKGQQEMNMKKVHLKAPVIMKEQNSQKNKMLEADKAYKDEQELLIEKDEAIEMIQTGPAQEFSNVLRQYLSSQQQQVARKQALTTTQLRGHRKTNTTVSEKLQSVLAVGTSSNNGGSMPETSFTRAQQNLKIPDRHSDRSIGGAILQHQTLMDQTKSYKQKHLLGSQLNNKNNSITKRSNTEQEILHLSKPTRSGLRTIDASKIQHQYSQQQQQSISNSVRKRKEIPEDYEKSQIKKKQIATDKSKAIFSTSLDQNKINDIVLNDNKDCQNSVEVSTKHQKQRIEQMKGAYLSFGGAIAAPEGSKGSLDPLVKQTNSSPRASINSLQKNQIVYKSQNKKQRQQSQNGKRQRTLENRQPLNDLLRNPIATQVKRQFTQNQLLYTNDDQSENRQHFSRGGRRSFVAQQQQQLNLQKQKDEPNMGRTKSVIPRRSTPSNNQQHQSRMPHQQSQLQQACWEKMTISPSEFSRNTVQQSRVRTMGDGCPEISTTPYGATSDNPQPRAAAPSILLMQAQHRQQFPGNYSMKQRSATARRALPANPAPQAVSTTIPQLPEQFNQAQKMMVEQAPIATQTVILNDHLQQYRADSFQKRRNITIDQSNNPGVASDSDPLQAAVQERPQPMTVTIDTTDNQNTVKEYQHLQQRPLLKRPSFLNNPSHSAMFNAYNGSQDNAADDQCGDTSFRQSAEHISGNRTMINRQAPADTSNRPVQRPQFDFETRLKLQRIEVRTKAQMDKNMLTLEEQLEKSSIMAIDLVDLNGKAAWEQEAAQVVQDDTRQAQILEAPIINKHMPSTIVVSGENPIQRGHILPAKGGSN